ncbi:ABC transporter substrate-binding protein [Mycoplasmatota bacterium WC44]
MRKIIILFLIAVMTITTFGCEKKQDDLITVRLSEVVHSVFYAPQYVALNKGFFEEEGLNIEFTTAWGADKVVTAIVSGNADIGLAGAEATIYVYDGGKEDHLVNFAQLTQKDGSFLVGREDEDFSWKNLGGKTIIGGRPGGMPEITLEHILKENSLEPHEDLEVITNIAFTATAGAFASGTGDYVALFEPTASSMELQGFKVLSSIGKDSGELPYTVYMAEKSYIQENPLIVQKFTNAIYKALMWVEEHTAEEIAKEVHPYFEETDFELIKMSVQRYKDQDIWDKNPILETASFDYLQSIIKESGHLEEKIDSNIVIDNTFAYEAVK